MCLDLMASLRLSSSDQASARGVAFDESWHLCAASVPSAPSPDLSALFTYRIPRVTLGDTCAKSLEPEPFDLHRALTGRPFDPEAVDAALAERISKLASIVKHVARCTTAEWVGVYRVVKSDVTAYPVLSGSETTLLKEAYVGAPSRPFFPLTEEFASKSNNSTVGRSGVAVIIQDTRRIGDDTPYYSCDGSVRSELCAPILDSDGSVIGIMDVESFAPSFFTPERVSFVLDMCAQLGTARLFT